MSTNSASTSSGPRPWRFKQVYVEIPPSPLHTARQFSASSLPSRLSFSSFNHKENTPLRPSITEHSDTQTNKRKHVSSFAQSPSKRAKIEASSATMAQEASADTTTLLNCHQCGVKRSSSAILQCTFSLCKNASKPTNTRRCNAKYCRNCLKNRYDEDLDRIAATTRGQKENGHAEASYVFKCPKCRGLCNCWRCRHKTANPIPDKAIIINKTEPKANVAAASTSNETVNVQVTHIPKPLVLPNVAWNKVPNQLPLKDTEDRIFIREFILRFSGIRGMSVPKAQLEELNYIGGHESNDDSGVYPSWVSELCVKSLVLSLIGVLAAEEDSSATLVMKNGMKEIRGAGTNMTKMWIVLSSMRTGLGRPEKPSETENLKEDESGDSDDKSSEDRIILEYPDPLPPPAAHGVRRTRFASTESPVVHTAQMIPVIVGLIEIVLESHAIRVELDEGAKEGRERIRESRECIKIENDLWDALRKSLEEAEVPDHTKIKAERQGHKSKVQAIENAAKVIASASLPRFSPLGSDPDGRTYWALTPGIYDREYALDYIVSRLPNAPKAKKARNRKHRHLKEEEDRKSLEEWTWFLAVFGKNPLKEESGNELQWWGFWDPAEIRNLAEWLSIKNGLKTNDSSVVSRSPESLKSLVKGLTEYATLLEWRVLGEDN